LIMELSPDVKGAARLCSMALLVIGGCMLLLYQHDFRAEHRDAVTVVGTLMVMIAMRLAIAEGRARERAEQEKRARTVG
jgi:uncharacterized protein YhhL (DUF1145 family)